MVLCWATRGEQFRQDLAKAVPMDAMTVKTVRLYTCIGARVLLYRASPPHGSHGGIFCSFGVKVVQRPQICAMPPSLSRCLGFRKPRTDGSRSLRCTSCDVVCRSIETNLWSVSEGNLF